jgi:hypothetical protein
MGKKETISMTRERQVGGRPVAKAMGGKLVSIVKKAIGE